MLALARQAAKQEAAAYETGIEEDPERYVGRYRNRGYAEIELTVTGEVLRGQVWAGAGLMGVITYACEHGDSFGCMALVELVHFEFGPDGQFVRMLVGDYPYEKAS